MNSKIIIYDFDGTLTKTSYPKYKIIENCGCEVLDFLKQANEYAYAKNLNIYSGFGEFYLEFLAQNNIPATEENICLGVENIEFNNGIEEFVKCHCQRGIKQYIVTSGFETYVKKSKIAPYFTDIKGVTFKYESDHIIGLDTTITELTKVDIIKDIVKTNHQKDCHNIIYIGDGLTDRYAMEYIKDNGGESICVYQNEKEFNYKNFRDVTTQIAPADYSHDSILSNYIEQLIK